MSLWRPGVGCIFSGVMSTAATPVPFSPAGSRLSAVTASRPICVTRDQVMTAPEVADLLHLPVSTVYYLARRGELPATRVGRSWRFLRPRIEQLLFES
jgi:excisionase family DNA binding protein